MRLRGGTSKYEILEYGVRVFTSRHREIRKLKRLHAPSRAFESGHRPGCRWISSTIEDAGRTRVMEVGCGWALSGIFCAKKRGAVVTGAGTDWEIFPYLRIHARVNNVEVSTPRMGFDELISEHLKGIKVMIGADICFLDSLSNSLRGLVCRALCEGVHLVIIGHPGRSGFDRLGEYFVAKFRGEIRDCAVQKPYRIQGKILKIDFFPNGYFFKCYLKGGRLILLWQIQLLRELAAIFQR